MGEPALIAWGLSVARGAAAAQFDAEARIRMSSISKFLVSMAVVSAAFSTFPLTGQVGVRRPGPRVRDPSGPYGMIDSRLANFGALSVFCDQGAEAVRRHIQGWSPQIAQAQTGAHVASPYEKSSREGALWAEQVDFNFPLCVSCAFLIQKEIEHLGVQRVLFARRDTLRLKKVFNALFPEIETEIFYTSRKATRIMSPSYLEYCKSILTQPCLIIDGFGSGRTFNLCFQKVGRSHPFRFVCGAGGKNSLTHSFGLADEFERVNAGTEGTLIDFTEAGPVLAECEHPIDLVEVQERAFEACLQQINRPVEHTEKDLEVATRILRQIDRRSASRFILEHITNH